MSNKPSLNNITENESENEVENINETQTENKTETKNDNKMIDIIENKADGLLVLPVDYGIVFPDCTVSFDVRDKKNIQTVIKSLNKDEIILIVMKKDCNEPVSLDNLYDICTVAQIINSNSNEKNGSELSITVKGLCRAKLTELNTKDKIFTGSCIIYKEIVLDKEFNAEQSVSYDMLKDAMFEYMKRRPDLDKEFTLRVQNTKSFDQFVDTVASVIDCSMENKMKLLELVDLDERLLFLISVLFELVEKEKLREKIFKNVKKKIDNNQKAAFLTEELRAIKEELGEDSEYDDAEEFAYKIEKLHLPKEVEEPLLKECSKLSRMSPHSLEASNIVTYLETCLDLPWKKSTKERLDLEKVRACLDKNHYGLDKIKERIIEALAVKKLTDNENSQILCFVGPPGVGKTSIAQSIAEAVNRKYAGVALGGVRDEAEIRGHGRTYVSALPGRIIKALIKCKSNNPLIVFDEVDKISADYKGDPASALLEVLDSEQNKSFVDRYIDVPFDLSKIMFITTANDLESIPLPLRDRMDIIELGSYTTEEKFNIAKKHIIPKCYKKTGLKLKNIKITDDVIYIIINNYTKEAGVRNLEKAINKILRKAAVKIVDGFTEKIVVDKDNIEEYLGSKKFKTEDSLGSDEIGVANGLAWTSVGGEVMPIEVAIMSGTGKIELTGSLGDVMKESAKTAITCIRSRANDLNIPEDFYKNYDIHIHAPEGAVPKDGPSAGITMATAVVSAFKNSSIKKSVAMTGEITLRGRVLPIGGLKEKSMAAYKLGIKEVIIPFDNISDLDEVDSVVKENVNFIPVKNINEVLEIAIN